MYSKKFGEPVNTGCAYLSANGKSLKWQYRVKLHLKRAENMISQSIKNVEDVTTIPNGSTK